MSLLRDHYYILIAAINVSLWMCLLVDTSAWWVRSLAGKGDMGLYVARTNVYSYSGRLFAFTYMTLLSLLVDAGDPPSQICLIVGSSFLLGACVHLATLSTRPYSQAMLRLVARRLRLQPSAGVSPHEPRPVNRRGVVTTAVASFFFCMAMSAPYILASTQPDFRLTIANLGQILNSIGMIFILFFVDQDLFRAWDREELATAVRSYSAGRVIGIAAAGTVLVSIYSAIRLIE